MKIEIAEPGRMTQTGSSLLKLIQNNNMPLLDLLVRESVQNSLDAKNDSDAYVTVKFITGNFEKAKLNAELEGITEKLDKQFTKPYQEYIAIRDTNTVGLTGKLHYSEVQDNNYGNLLKLIYEISKPQTAEGAGGSWGLGKTVYFRIGIGLVVYYSRIKNEHGQFESRLAASFVENELSPEAKIPIYQNKAKRGIAWWGERIGENETQPVTDVSYINKILSIFKIPAYMGEETGTTIIIPYIDRDKLLESNQIEYKDNNENLLKTFWQSNLEEYLKISLQRWYAPRLNNPHYKYGKYLRAIVNDEGITYDLMEPVFQVIQSLYNTAAGVKLPQGDILNKVEEKKHDNISLRSVMTSTNAGTIAYAKVDKNLLKISAPHNKPVPYMYMNCEIKEKEANRAIVSFTRKPGMIVSYENTGHWVDGIPSAAQDEYILGVFVLNSDNMLLQIESSLEEYVRKSEMADHTSWSDYSIGTFNPRIISKIQKQAAGKIAKEFAVNEDNSESKVNSGLSRVFGEMLLPPQNFGKKPSGGTGGNSGQTPIGKTSDAKLTMDKQNIRYSSDTMTVPFQLKAGTKTDISGVVLGIASETGTIKVHDWENKMGMDMPFEIQKAVLSFKDKQRQFSEIELISLETVAENEVCVANINVSAKQRGCELIIHKKETIELDMTIQLTLRMYRRDLKPVFSLAKNEGDN